MQPYWHVMGASENQEERNGPVLFVPSPEAEQQLRLHGKNELEERQTSKLLIFLKLVRRQHIQSTRPSGQITLEQPSTYLSMRDQVQKCIKIQSKCPCSCNRVRQ